MELAEKSLEIARTRYENGLATYLDFTDANLSLNVARLTRLQARLEALDCEPHALIVPEPMASTENESGALAA